MPAASKPVLLTGHDLTIHDVVRVARYGCPVAIAPEAMATMQRSRDFVLEMTRTQAPIYGFTTGVGLNKDQPVHQDFASYNHSLLLSHCDGVGPFESAAHVRATMLVRLNTLLLGYTGAQPTIAQMLAQFLNHHIHPTLPERGSVGEADLTSMAFIGMCLIGEGMCDYKQRRMKSGEVMAQLGLQPLQLGPKDGLAIVSTNALAAGMAAIALAELEDLADTADVVYAMTMEGYKANVSPIDPALAPTRNRPGHDRSVTFLHRLLNGSYLWGPDLQRALQDPLSLRCASTVHGALRDSIDYVGQALHRQINGCEDNPCVLVDEGRILSTGNFETTTWVLGFEMLGVALSHVSKMSCYRSIKLDTPSFTGLPRFLSGKDKVLAYATMQKTFTALDSEIRHLSNPASTDYFPLAGDIEDHANNGPYVVHKTSKMIDNLWYILGMEAMHAAQAMDLRPERPFGKGSEVAHRLFRQHVAFLEQDRVLSVDIQKAYKLLKRHTLLRTVRKALNYETPSGLSGGGGSKVVAAKATSETVRPAKKTQRRPAPIN